MSDEEEDFGGFGDDFNEGGEEAGLKKKGPMIRTRTLDPKSKIATLGKSIRLPMGLGGAAAPTGGVGLPGMSEAPGTESHDPKARLDKVGAYTSAMAEHTPDYEESWEEKESREAEERRAAGVDPKARLAKMLMASNASRGIMTGPGLGLAGIMGGKKKMPGVTLDAPYSEHKAGGKAITQEGGAKPFKLPAMGGPPGGLGALIAGASKGATTDAAEGGGTGGDDDAGVKAAPADVAKKIVQKDKSGLKVIGCGSGGVEEMHEHLSEDTVQWGLLRFQIGSGTFKRNKMLMIHFNGHNCPGPRRAKLNRSSSAVESAFGHIAQKLDITEIEEAHLDNILEMTKKTFAADAHMDFSIGDFKAEYESMIAESRRKVIEAMIAGDGESAKRKTAKELGVEAEKALELVRKPMGPFNWALFKPDPADFTLYDAGSLGVNEMLGLLPDDGILCGLIRMGFGAGKWRRTKYVSIWWAGPKVGAHAKGAASGHGREHTMRRLNPSIGPMEGHETDDLSLENIIDKVKRAAVIDGDGVDGVGGASGDAAEDPFSMDAYYAALAEEAGANAAFFGEKSADESHRSFGVAHTIREVRAEGGKYTWVLVEADP